MTVRILEGDALAMLRTLESESVQCVVTSPPYYGLRDYGVDGQIGLETTPAAFIAALLAVFDEVRRVLHPAGVVFCNLGDSYSGSGKGPTGHNGIGDQSQRQGFVSAPEQRGDAIHPKTTNGFGTLGATSLRGYPGLKAKDLMLIPQRFAIGMQDAGWWVRSEIAWCKTSAMPESVRDRPSSAWEPIWMFTKSRTYFWDQEAVRQPVARDFTGQHRGGPMDVLTGLDRNESSQNGLAAAVPHPAGANLRNYWLLGPEPSSLEHYAGFPTEIPRRCIKAATSEKGQCPACGAPWVRVVERQYVKSPAHGDGSQMRKRCEGTEVNGWAGMPRVALQTDTTGWQPSCQCDAGEPVPQTVLDPFAGSFTTSLVAERLGRDSIGIELSPAYVKLGRNRLVDDSPMFNDDIRVLTPRSMRPQDDILL